MGKRQSLTKINEELKEEIFQLGRDIDYLCQQVADYEWVLRYYQQGLKHHWRAADMVLTEYCGTQPQIMH